MVLNTKACWVVVPMVLLLLRLGPYAYLSMPSLLSSKCVHDPIDHKMLKKISFLYYSLQNWEITSEITQFLWAGPSSFANQCMLFVGLLICYKKPHTDPKSLLATESLQNPHTWDRDALTRGCSFKHHLTSEILTSLMALTEWSLGSYFGIGRNLQLCYRQPIKKTRSEW